MGMSRHFDLALVLSGGGARAAYQVGFLRFLARQLPDVVPGILTGVSAGGIFLDLLDGDALHLQQINQLAARLPEAERDGLRHIDLLVLRPSQDLGQLANQFEPELPSTFRFLTRGLGTRETRSNDLLSLVMFQSNYLRQLIEMGEADAAARMDDIRQFLEP